LVPGNVLNQTHWAGSFPGPENWRFIFYHRLKLLNWNAALADVRPFMERPEIDLLTLENLGRLLHQIE